ncbi:MAG: EF-P beta-lysylation protein EpmB [Gammaproteobacteria bacterium]|nr:MAG: EF-P beta-lysylation protein EpmB [Gammaproteobacteria bacterium]
MITGSATTVDSLSWQEQLATSIRDPQQLLQLLQLDPALLDGALAAHGDFPLRVPQAYLQRIEQGNPDDPLLRQVLPLGTELLATPGYNADPLEELNANPAPGLVHKYHGRVLLIVSPNCAINCRYCFRRHFPYGDNKPGRGEWQQALDYIAADTSISEVIFSGGDPLAASDRQLQWLVEQLQQIPHLQRLRIHSRLPVVIPDRVTDHLLHWLGDNRFLTSLVIHSNHANELDMAVQQALQRLREAGVTLLNQAVLLAGVNDRAEVLCHLSERLFECGTLPYYLHQLDRVSGAAHFAVSDQTACELHSTLMATLPGYLVPKLVRETPEAPHKVPLISNATPKKL